MTKRSFLFRIAALTVTAIALVTGQESAVAKLAYYRNHSYWLWRHRRYHRRRYYL